MKTKPFLLAVALLSATTDTGKGQATLQFSAGSYTVSEGAGTVTLMVQRTGNTHFAVTVDYATTDGTATSGLKYTAVSGTLAFGADETDKSIVVPILDERFVEGDKNFLVTLSNPSSKAVLGTPTTATVTISDNDVGFDVGIQFQFATYSIAEDSGSAQIAVVRGDDGALPVTVNFATTDQTGISGVDYVGATNTLSFSAQERLKTVAVPILNNTLKQPNRTFQVTLANPSGARLGSQTTSIITIVDNDQGFQFATTTYSVAEDAGVVRIGVLRGTDATNSAVTVDYATIDGSAINNVDYTGSTNTLSFAAGERVKIITVPILNNGVKQGTRTFTLTLRNPTGGGVLGSPTTSTVSILDNDSGVGFERTDYTNSWGSAGGFAVTVLRGNDWFLGPITVDYATSDLTALAGQDYQAVSGTLQFQQNETVKNLVIPLLRARPAGPRTFRITLSNATGGATLGISSATVNIVGAYFLVAPPFDTALTIQRSGSFNTLSWTGGGWLQRADRPTGPWLTLTTASNSYTVRSAIPTAFYRVARPRPVNVYVPSSYGGQTPVPLVILLHGFTTSGASQEDYMQFQPLAEARGFLYCYPESPFDRWGNVPWNATDSCCDFGGAGIDDAGYLRSLIGEIGHRFSMDRKRVYLIGHSNGGFMAYRMACQSADVIAAIASLAGMTFMDPAACHPVAPINVLHIHGTADDRVPYAGSALTSDMFPGNLPAFPGALATVQRWAAYNGANNPVSDPGPSLDLDLDVPGVDTVITRYTSAPPGGAVELWTINGGSHSPTLYSGSSASEFAPRVIDWLLAHPKP